MPGGRPRVARSGKIRRSAGGWTSNALRAGQRQSEQGVTEAVRHHPKEPCQPTWLADVGRDARCVARARTNQTLSVSACRQLAKRVGVITEFGDSRDKLPAEKLAACRPSR